MKAKFLGSLGLAILLAQFTSVNATPSTTTSKTISANKEMDRGVEFKKRRKDSLPDMIGGIQMENIMNNGGIPPHIYGQQHVRRGTHKRSNCK